MFFLEISAINTSTMNDFVFEHILVITVCCVGRNLFKMLGFLLNTVQHFLIGI